MKIISAIITALGAAVTLFILSKLMGNRQISQLSVFDYINSITIGSIATEMATCEFTDLSKPFTSMIVFALFNILLSFLTNKSIKLRLLVIGKQLLSSNLIAKSAFFQSPRSILLQAKT